MSVASEKSTLKAWNDYLRFRRFGAMNPREFTLKERARFALVAGVVRLFMRLATETCRWKVEGDEGIRHELLHGRRSYIFLMWHNRLPVFFCYTDSFCRRNPDFRIDSIVSASRDGELLARPIRELGGGEIRGSSSRDAVHALRSAVQAARNGANIATVGDGPKGPRYRLKPGPLLLAKATGLPILPLTWSCSRVLQFHRSWDQLMMPLPFSKIHVRVGEPFQVPHGASPRDIARARRELEKRLAAMTEWADANTRVMIQYPPAKAGEVLKRRPRIELSGRHFD